MTLTQKKIVVLMDRILNDEKWKGLRVCQLIQNCYSTEDIYYVTDEKLLKDLQHVYYDRLKDKK